MYALQQEIQHRNIQDRIQYLCTINSTIPGRGRIFSDPKRGDCYNISNIKDQPMTLYERGTQSGLKFQLMPYFGFKRVSYMQNLKLLNFDKIKLYQCGKFCWQDDPKYLDKDLIRSQIPGHIQFTDKSLLAKNIQRSKTPEIVPKTFVLPEQKHEFIKDIKKYDGFYIVKPVGGSQGKGIIISKDQKEILNHCEQINNLSSNGYVVQHYLDKSILYQNRKFDLRVYVLITSVDPLIVYVYKDSMIRFAVENFVDIEESNADDIFMHLTNFHVGNQNKQIKPTNLKGKIQEVFENLVKDDQNKLQFDKDIQQNLSVDFLYQNLYDCIEKLFTSTYKEVLEQATNEYPHYVYSYPRKFHGIYGVDLLLTSSGQFKVLEINSRPSFKYTDQNDKLLKTNVIYETFDMLGVMYDKIPHDEDPNNYAQLLTQTNLTNQQKQVIYQLIDERSRLKIFHPIQFKNITMGKFNQLVNQNYEIIKNETRILNQQYRKITKKIIDQNPESFEYQQQDQNNNEQKQ